MKKAFTRLAIVATSLLLIGAGCSYRATPPAQPGGEKPSVSEQNGAPVAARSEIKLARNDTSGEFFTDGKGMTLYLFNKDTADKSVCVGQCLSYWPIFYGGADLVIPGSLNKADFGETTTPDGQKITTYQGWPLYYYIGDKNPGDTLGENVNKVWFVMKPKYSVQFVADDSGNRLVDGRGRTLYLFTKDSKGKSVCEGQCLVNWPPFYEPASDLIIPSTWSKADFGETTTLSGQKIATYKGWPLYYYINDKARGDKTGQGVGGVWFTIDQDKQAAAL